MDITGFLLFLLLAAGVVLLSYGLDLLYSAVLPFRVLYYAVRMPGVALHEISHVIGCLAVGARIENVVLFSKDGGSVTHGRPKVPLIGTVIISTAPLLLLPLFLALLTVLLPAVSGIPVPVDLPPAGSAVTLPVLASAVGRIFGAGVSVLLSGWFILYLYLVITIILSLAPSRQDFANAVAGTAVIAAACILIIAAGYEPAVAVLDAILTILAYVFTIGLVFEVIAVIFSLPLVLVYFLKKRG